MHSDGLFENLPPEILLDIVFRLPDLESLDTLLRASPNAWRFFAVHGAAVTDHILNSGFLHSHIQVAIRIVAFIRQGCFPITTLQDLLTQVTGEAIRHSFNPSENAFSPTKFPSPTSPAVMRGIIVTARRIKASTLDCLQFYLYRFRQLRPYQRPEYGGETLNKHGLPELVQCVRRDIGPPTWVEEQRVCRALWRIQLVEDLKKALRKGVITTWCRSDVALLKNMQLADIYCYKEVAAEFREMQLHDAPISDFTEQTMISTVMEYLNERSLARFQASLSRPRPWPAPQPEDGDWSAVAAQWADEIQEFDHDLGYSHMAKKLTSGPYRRLGFGIWSSLRLREYGFNKPRGLFTDDVIVAWISVLGIEDVEILRRSGRFIVYCDIVRAARFDLLRRKIAKAVRH